jgi:hypothetical protein
MSAPVRVIASVLAVLGAPSALADVRPVPSGPRGPVVAPVPVPGHGPGYGGPGYGHGPGRGPGRGPGHGPGHGPGYPTPYPGPVPGYPPTATETITCRPMYGGRDAIVVREIFGRRADYLVDVDALGIVGRQLKVFVQQRYNDSMLLQVQTQYGPALLNIGYLNHPYGPTAVFSFGGSYQEFKCTRHMPPPGSYPQPMPPSPYPFPRR